MRQEFNKDQIVYLDIIRYNKSKVQVISQTQDKLYTKVTDNENIWDVMTVRLTKI